MCLQQGKQTLEDSIRQVSAALLTGNTVIHISDSTFDYSQYIEQAGLSQVYQRVAINSQPQLQDYLLAKHLQGVAASGSDALLQWLDSTLAKREGHLLPLITETNGPVLMHRFVLEKAVSNNTTASGGNTSLLAMSDG